MLAPPYTDGWWDGWARWTGANKRGELDATAKGQVASTEPVTWSRSITGYSDLHISTSHSMASSPLQAFCDGDWKLHACVTSQGHYTVTLYPAAQNQTRVGLGPTVSAVGESLGALGRGSWKILRENFTLVVTVMGYCVPCGRTVRFETWSIWTCACSLQEARRGDETRHSSFHATCDWGDSEKILLGFLFSQQEYYYNRIYIFLPS